MLPTRTGSAANDMAAVMARVRKMSDSQLADILSGKDVSVPQFAAMTEAMGRKQLRQAVDGAQAQQQAQQPSVKDQLLAEQSGLAAIPAPNMESMDMAGGGIIAFEDGGEVPRFQDAGLVDPLAYLSGQDVLGRGMDEARREALLARRKREEDKERLAFLKTAAPEVAARLEAESTPPVAPAAAPAAPPAAPAVDPNAPKGERLKLDAGKDSGKDAGITAIPDRKDFLGQYEGTGARMREGIAALKDAKQSDFLLGASKALLGNANLAKAGAEFSGTAMELGAKARREEREIGKAADEYDFNLAKAREAAAQGNQDLAYKYAALADQARYRAGILGIKGQELSMQQGMYDMVKVPAQLSKVYADATKAVKDATANRPVKPGEFQRLVDEEYRKRANSVGLGKFIDTYSPSTSLSTVSQLPKGVSAMKLPDDA
jgi:hypothetical protein